MKKSEYFASLMVLDYLGKCLIALNNNDARLMNLKIMYNNVLNFHLTFNGQALVQNLS